MTVVPTSTTNIGIPNLRNVKRHNPPPRPTHLITVTHRSAPQKDTDIIMVQPAPRTSILTHTPYRPTPDSCQLTCGGEDEEDDDDDDDDLEQDADDMAALLSTSSECVQPPTNRGRFHAPAISAPKAVPCRKPRWSVGRPI